MTNKRNHRILIAAGGTGGHIFPGLAVAHELSKRGVEVEWVGTPVHMENQLVPPHYKLHHINARSFVNKGKLGKIFAIIGNIWEGWKLRKLIKQEKFDLVFSLGGYISVPPLFAARFAGVPYVTHEGNSVMGMATKLADKLNSEILFAFNPTPNQALKDNWKVVGMPLRADIIEQTQDQQQVFFQLRQKCLQEVQLLKEYLETNSFLTDELAQLFAQTWQHLDLVAPIEQDLALLQELYTQSYEQLTAEQQQEFNILSFARIPLQVFAMGGSLGAQVLNENLAPCFAQLAKQGCQFSVLQQCGKGNSEAVNQEATKLGLSTEQFQATDFIEQVISHYLAADLVICRSGATTVFEVTRAGRCAIFVPYAGHKDQQQLKNARHVANIKGGEIVLNQDLKDNYQVLSQTILNLNYFKLLTASLASYKFSQSNSSEVIADILITKE